MDTTTTTPTINLVIESNAAAMPVAVASPAVLSHANGPARFAAIYDQLTQLVADRQAWETTHLKTANDALYLLLQRCYRIYEAAIRNTADAALLQVAIEDYFNLNGLKLDKNTHTLNNIVRIVFGSDGKRASAYARALRVALGRKLPSADLPDFIRSEGGCEEVRRKGKSSSSTALTAEQKADQAKTWLSADDLGTFRNDALARELDAAKVGNQHLLIVTQQLDGSLKVNGLISTAGVVQSALAAYYTQHKDAQHNQASAQLATNANAVVDAAITAAANSVAA